MTNNPSTLDPTLIAKAFAVALPAHSASLALTHNDHKAHSQLVGSYYEPAEFIHPLEHQKAMSMNECWSLSWLDADGTGVLIRAATIEALINWCVNNGESYGG